MQEKVSSVMAMLACPSISETTFGLTFLDSRSVAQVCRRSWKRVPAGRPALGSRCERAAGILAEHAAAPRSGVIRGQLRGGELVGYLVRGSGRAVYRVEAKGSWRCSCPDHHGRHRRRGSSRACKHGLAVWALWRAASAAPSEAVAAVVEAVEAERPVGCAGCGCAYRRSELVELHEDNHDNLTHFHGDLLCGVCCDWAGVLR